MSKLKIALFFILVSIAGNILLGLQYFRINQELIKMKSALQAEKMNRKVLEFLRLFIQKVLKAETEVDFETRLKLENAVRDLNDEQILDQWKRFTESKTELEAQTEVKDLLEILVEKIQP